MTQLIDDVTYLSNEIGPRPAGTEEEQQAALYIADSIQRDSGFQAVIEDFDGMANPDVPKAICFGLVLVCGLVSLLVPLLTLPAAVVGIIAAVLYGLEITGRPLLSRALKGGVSQNVVAKYKPSGVPGKRRKIILVANYDSGRVVPDQKGVLQANRRAIEFVSLGGLVALPLILLVHGVVFPSASGVVGTVFSVLTVAAMVLVAVPVVFSLVHLRAEYTDAANNNASGVAVLLDVARKVGNGCVSLKEMERLAEEGGSEVEGENAAREAGVITDDYEVEYAARPTVEPSNAASSRLEDEDDVEAVSAVNERHVEDEPAVDVEAPEPASAEADESQVSVEAGSVAAEVPVAASTPVPATPFPASNMVGGIPSWARAAQAKARENKPEEMNRTPVARSRYADTPAAQILDHEVASHTGAFAPVSSYASPAQPVQPVEPDAFVEPAVSAPSQELDPEASSQAAAAEPVEQVRESKPAPSYGQNSFVNPWSDPSIASGNSDLSARLAALRSEIQSAPVPHVSEEVRKAFDEMDTPKPAPAPKRVSRETSEDEPANTVSTSADEPQQAPLPEEVSVSDRVEPIAGNEEQEQKLDAVVEDVAEPTIDANELASDEPVVEEEEQEEKPLSRTARSLRRGANSSFDGFMGRIHKVAENMADAASEAGSRLGEAASEAGSRFASGRNQEPEVSEPEDQDVIVEDEHYVGESHDVRGVEPDVSEMDSFEDIETTEVDYVEEGLRPNDDDELTSAEPEAVAALDVSAFMNKPLAAPASSGKEDDVADETTQPVSMAEIREAMAHTSAVTPKPAAQEVPSSQQSQEDKGVAAPVSPIVGLDLESLPAIGEVSQGKQQVITLPELDAVKAEPVEAASQRAPMAQSSNVHSPLTSGAIPRISMSDLAREESSSDRFGLDLPPLGAESEVSHEKVSATSSFSTAGGTGAFAPVGDELVEGVPEENLYVEDVDDSAFEENHTETGAFAGPEYVDLPQSRVGKLFGRFGSRKKKNAEEGSMKEWIGADEDYTAHGAGVDRGSWESFREGDEGKPSSGNWNGGAFSLDSLRNLGGVKALGNKFGKVSESSEPEKTASVSLYDDEYVDRKVFVDEFNEPVQPEVNSRVEELNREMRQLNEFRHPGIDTEVWFVALGSEIGSSCGMHAFLQNHADELDGAIIVNLQALGAGKLSYIDTEGVLFPVKPSSRMKRFVRQASIRSKVSYGMAKLLSVETPASYASRQGYQAFSVVGVKDGKPAYYAEAEDRIENINPRALEDASKLVMELLKVI
ncbi:MAG: hypothetical protein Q4F23_00510 [Coriobacteriia bacterium]|nr:hypothetical protein [Coriobacteriia bacterium]